MPIIELMGLPGAGKSTLATKWLDAEPRLQRLDDAYWTAAHGGARGVIERLLALLPRVLKTPLSGPLARLDMAHRFMSREAAFAGVVFKEVASLPDPLHRQSFLHAWLKYIAQREVIERHLPSDKRVLVEEGFAHRAMTLFGYLTEAPSAERITAYVANMPKPKAVVWVDTPPETCSERLKKRPEPPLPLIGVPQRTWTERLIVGRGVMATMANGLADAGVAVLTVKDVMAESGPMLDRLRATVNLGAA